MATVYPLIRSSVMLGRVETERAERDTRALLALDDLAREIARAGFGMGSEAQRLAAGVPGLPPGSDGITVRSNPEGLVGWLGGELSAKQPSVPVAGAQRFVSGDFVLLADARRRFERAAVTSVERGRLAFRSLLDPKGQVQRVFKVEDGSRVIKMREVRFFLETPPGEKAPALMKQINQAPARILARGVAEFHFEYLDSAGEAVAPARVTWASDLAVVRIRLGLKPQLGPNDPSPLLPPLTTSVALESQSATVAFDEPRRGLRLVGHFTPIANAVWVASRPLLDVGVILAAGQPREAGLGYLYSFLTQRNSGCPTALDTRVETVYLLPEVRDAVAAVFAPEESALAGSLFVVSGAAGNVRIWRVLTEADQTIGPKSFLGVETAPRAMGAVRGAAFGIDGAIYLTDPSQRAVWRYRPQADPAAGTIEKVGVVDGTPGSIVSAESGSLYLMVDRGGSSDSRTALWEVRLPETPSPPSLRLAATLPGGPGSLALDPISGSLFALCQDLGGDSVLYQLSTAWLRNPSNRPPEAFRLSRFKREMEVTLPNPDTVILPAPFFPSRIAFAAFDADGSLYLGATPAGLPAAKADVVSLLLKFEIDRPGGLARHRVAVASIVEQEPDSARKRLRLYAWKRPTSVR